LRSHEWPALIDSFIQSRWPLPPRSNIILAGEQAANVHRPHKLHRDSITQRRGSLAFTA